MLLTKTARSQVELLLTNNPWGTGGALQSALQSTRVSAGWLHTLWLKAEFGSRRTVPSQQTRSINFIRVQEARIMSATRKSIVPAGIGAALCPLRDQCASVQRNELFKCHLWPMSERRLETVMILRPHKLLSFHLTNVRQSHEAGFATQGAFLGANESYACCWHSTWVYPAHTRLPTSLKKKKDYLCPVCWKSCIDSTGNNSSFIFINYSSVPWMPKQKEILVSINFY